MIAVSRPRRVVPVALPAFLAFFGLAGVAIAQPPPGSAVSFKAAGNEPGWTIDIGANRMVLVADNGATRAEVLLPAPVPVEGGRRYDARTDAHTIVVTILERVCADTMTGMPRPSTVEVSLDGRMLKGCGGDPTSLLRGGTWLVSQIGGRPIVAMSRVTLAFSANGRVAGDASCNTFRAGYVLTGDAITMTMPIAAMRTCEPPYMAQETVFLEVLRGVNRFELAADGTLTLHAADGGTITARREDVAAVVPKNPAKPR